MIPEFDLRRSLLTAVLALGLGGALTFAHRTTQERATQRATATLPPVVQTAPTVTLFDEVVSPRRIVGTPELVERMASAPESGEVVRISDHLVGSGGSVTLERRVVRQVERPLPLLKSSIDTAFTSETNAFRAAFGATYEWENPNATPARVRFAFPSPSTGAELEAFSPKVGSQEIREASPAGEYVWSGVVPPRTRIAAAVGYRTRGASTYRYDPGMARIGALELRTRGDRAPEVLRTSPKPEETKTTSAVWRLSDVRTAAPIAFGFATPLVERGDLDRAMRFAPFALAVFALGAVLVRARRAPAATLGFGLGLLGIGALATYLPPLTTLGTGAILGGVLGGIALNSKRGAFVAVASTALAVIPAMTGHATLAAWALGLLVVGAAVGRPRETKVRRRDVATPGRNVYVS